MHWENLSALSPFMTFQRAVVRGILIRFSALFTEACTQKNPKWTQLFPGQSSPWFIQTICTNVVTHSFPVRITADAADCEVCSNHLHRICCAAARLFFFFFFFSSHTFKAVFTFACTSDDKFTAWWSLHTLAFSRCDPKSEWSVEKRPATIYLKELRRGVEWVLICFG